MYPTGCCILHGFKNTHTQLSFNQKLSTTTPIINALSQCTQIKRITAAKPNRPKKLPDQTILSPWTMFYTRILDKSCALFKSLEGMVFMSADLWEQKVSRIKKSEKLSSKKIYERVLKLANENEFHWTLDLITLAFSLKI